MLRFALLGLCGCSPRREPGMVGAAVPETPEQTSTARRAAPPHSHPELGTCARIAPPRAISSLQDPELAEISGMVASSRQPGVLFVHNDSGDQARFFALDQHARKLAEFDVPAFWFDCEDMAVGPGSQGVDYLYFGDIGDNLARSKLGIARREISVYRLLEPDVPASGHAAIDPSAVDTFRFRYPDGAHDAEVLLLDPLTSDLYVVTKEARGHSLVFRAPAGEPHDAAQTLQLVAELALGSAALPGSSEPTAGDIARSGNAIIIRTYSTTFLWRRAPGASVADALRGKPLTLPTPDQPQGEALAFSADARGYFTVSERSGQPLYWVGCE